MASYGLTTSDAGIVSNDIFAAPYDPTAILSVSLTSATQELPRGQILTKAATGKYGPVADDTAFAALDGDDNVAVLLNPVKQVAAEAVAAVITKGNFVKDKLTPDDIPAGSYFHGNFIIETEVGK